MFRKIITASIVAASAIAAGSAFASSGYGPAPHYDPLAGAPASQRGVSAQSFAAEALQADANAQGYGGMADTASQAGGVSIAHGGAAVLFAHH
jgi:hypothetical protein